MTPSHFVIFLKGNLLRISSSLEIILFLRFHRVRCDWNFLELFLTSSVSLNFSGIVRIVWLCQVGAGIEFSMLVGFIFLCIGSDRICHACWYFLGTRLEFAVHVSVFFPLAWIPCLFSCLFYLVSITCHFFSCFFLLIQSVGAWLFLRGHWRQTFFLGI